VFDDGGGGELLPLCPFLSLSHFLCFVCMLLCVPDTRFSFFFQEFVVPFHFCCIPALSPSAHAACEDLDKD
jgi:hypothetical protein